MTQPNSSITVSQLLLLNEDRPPGGYLARAKDPPPGNADMWRGMSRLTDIELGFVMGAQLVGN